MSGRRFLLRRLPDPLLGARCRHGDRRRGTSLLEVMLATVMLLGCVMALSRVAFLARRHALGAEDRSLSQIYCQNIMEEILAGARPLQSVSPTSFEGDLWVYMVDVEGMEQADLTQVSVTVDRLDDPEGALPTEDDLVGYRLVRWVRTGGRTIDLDMLEGDPGASDPGESVEEEPLEGME